MAVGFSTCGRDVKWSTDSQGRKMSKGGRAGGDIRTGGVKVRSRRAVVEHWVFWGGRGMLGGKRYRYITRGWVKWPICPAQESRPQSGKLWGRRRNRTWGGGGGGEKKRSFLPPDVRLLYGQNTERRKWSRFVGTIQLLFAQVQRKHSRAKCLSIPPKARVRRTGGKSRETQNSRGRARSYPIVTR